MGVMRYCVFDNLSLSPVSSHPWRGETGGENLLLLAFVPQPFHLVHADVEQPHLPE